MPDRSRRSFSRFFYAAQRNAGAAPPAPPPPLPVTRSQRDDEIKLWPDFTPPSSPRAPSFPFFRPPLLPLSLRPRVLFLSWSDGGGGHAIFLSSILSFSRERSASPRSRSTLPSPPVFLYSCFELYPDGVRPISHRGIVGFREKAETWRPKTVLRRGSPRGGILPIRPTHFEIVATGSNFRWLDGSRDTRTENTKPCCLAHLERWLSSDDNDTTYRDTR